MKPKYPDAAAVWQRVLPPEPREQQSLQLLMRQLGLDIAYLKQLSKNNEDRILGLLVQELTGQLFCLKGLLTLNGGAERHIPEGKATGHSLPRCYDHALQRLGSYQLRTSDPVYGPAFQELATQTRQHCRLIPELLGRLPEPKYKGRIPAR